MRSFCIFVILLLSVLQVIDYCPCSITVYRWIIDTLHFCFHMDVHELVAVLEHTVVAVFGKCRSRKCWSGCQGTAEMEHLVVAVVSKCYSRKCWSGCQVRAIVKHAIVAVVSKCRSRKFWSLCQRIAVLEHVLVAVFWNISSLSSRIYQILYVSRCLYRT